MTIHFSCVSCSKSYSVPPDLAGRKAKCKQCGTPFVVPHAPVVPQESGDPVRQSPANRPDPFLHPDEKTYDLNYQIGNSVASNPGRTSVNFIRYAQAYPFWVSVWHGMVFAGIVMTLLSLFFFPIVIFSGFCVYKFWNNVINQFRSGCANPAKVISLDPPLIAVYSDLTKGDYETPVIKIDRQPIHKMSSGTPQLGQQIATVSFYGDTHGGAHWTTFDPKPLACATNDQQQIQRIMHSLDPVDWQKLDYGLQQIPAKMKRGYYRVYKPELLNRPFQHDLNTVVRIVQSFNEKRTGAIRGTQLDQQQFRNVQSLAGQIRRADLLWLIESMVNPGGQQGMALTTAGVFFNYPETGKGQFGWHDVVGGLSSNSGLEIMLRDRTRIRIPDRHFVRGGLLNLDVMFDAINGRKLDSVFFRR